MDNNQKQDYLEGIEDYLEEYKVYDYFYELMKELAIYRPDDPVDFLIDRISKSECYKCVIMGPPGFSRLGLGKGIAERIGWKYLNMSDWINEDEKLLKEKDEQSESKETRETRKEKKKAQKLEKQRQEEEGKQTKEPEDRQNNEHDENKNEKQGK